MKMNQKYDVKQVGETRVLEFYIYGEICPGYKDLWGDYHPSETSADYIARAINKAGTFDKINIYINSCGGWVSEGVSINNILKRVDKPVHVYIDGFAFSAASVIAMAGDKVIMPSNTVMMIHKATMEAWGTSDDLRKAADSLDVINEASCNSYLSKSSVLTKDELHEMVEVETFLSAEQALEYGLCDEIANPVDLNESVEVAEQAARNKNPYAKKAIEQIWKVKKEQTPEPQPQQPAQKEQDCFEWLKEQFNFT